MAWSLESILSSERLPSLPEVAARVVEIARDPDPDFGRLIATIRTDAAIAGRILKTANSALLGMRTRAGSIEQAVPRLGTTMVRTLVLSFTLAEIQNRSVELRPWYQRIWRESLTQAAVVEILADRQGGRVDPANWFLAGLVQDIGRLALLHTCQEEYVTNVLNVQDGRSERERELAWLGFTHVEVSTGLCRRWNLDADLVDAISVHHASAQRVIPLKFVSSTSLAAALITASHVSDYLEEIGHDLSCSREQIERLLMQVFAVRPNEVFRVLADVDTRIGELSATFGIDVGRAPSLESILAEAQDLLSQIALASQLRLVSSSFPNRPERPNDTVNHVAWRDQLTGTFNRSWLEPALNSVIDQAHLHQVPIGLLFVDLDRFRGLNAAAGTAVGDGVLQKAATILRNSVRLSDSVVRYGGDEFVVTLKDVNADMLQLLAGQIVQQIQNELGSDSSSYPVTCSLGAVLYSPGSGTPLRADLMIREADQAVRTAQQKGGNCCELRVCESGKWQAMPVLSGSNR